MSITGLMQTSTAGMAVETNRLSAISDNLANSGTTGYKSAGVEFATLVESSGVAGYQSGSVISETRKNTTQQGALNYTNSHTDLAVDGGGFFVVTNPAGQTMLTRAGGFSTDVNGNLVNAAGYKLQGYDLSKDPSGSGVANGTAGLVPVNIASLSLKATPTTTGTLQVNLNSDATIVAAANLPSTNASGAAYTSKTSLQTYDNLGKSTTLDIYYSKTAANTWDVTTFNQADAAGGGGFPYASAPLSVSTLTFDPTTGVIAAGGASAANITLPGGAPVALNFTGTSQLATPFSVISATANGNPAQAVSDVSISGDGVVSGVYPNGNTAKLFKIPLATVISPDSMTAVTGNAYIPNAESGNLQIGSARTGSFGNVTAGALEQSTVDMTGQLTDMIETQRSYTANSKAFQVGSEIMDVIINLVR